MGGWDTFWTDKKHGFVPRPYIKDLVPLFKKRGTKTILDLGCGAGRHLVYLAQQGFFVVGQDISQAGLKMAQQHLKSEHLYNCILVHHDVTKLPFPDGSFNAVISTNALHHNRLKDINRAIGEIYRVLARNGILFVNLTADEEHTKGRMIEKGSYVTTKGIEKGIIHHLFTEKEIEKSFSKFKVIRLTPPTEQEKHWLLLAEKI
ncbi:Methyltransferase type 11 [mine drainage metagenome]|uniref:Methyltransferase type 11 n=1 Tax=mine drainage metagenome TaxID=410659 RepID=T0Y6Z1_9ZZZZ